MADARVAYRVDWTGVAGWGGSKSRQPGGERGPETEDHSSTGESARVRAGEVRMSRVELELKMQEVSRRRESAELVEGRSRTPRHAQPLPDPALAMHSGIRKVALFHQAIDF